MLAFAYINELYIFTSIAMLVVYEFNVRCLIFFVSDLLRIIQRTVAVSTRCGLVN